MTKCDISTSLKEEKQKTMDKTLRGYYENRYAMRTCIKPLGRRWGAGNKGAEPCLIKIAKFESDTGCSFNFLVNIQNLAWKCLLDREEVKLWLKHLHLVEKNRSKGAEKARVSRQGREFICPSPTNLQGRLNFTINKLFPTNRNQDVNSILPNIGYEYRSLYVPDKRHAYQ